MISTYNITLCIFLYNLKKYQWFLLYLLVNKVLSRYLHYEHIYRDAWRKLALHCCSVIGIN